MIRLADVGDADRLAEVHVASWQEAYRGTFPDDFLDTLDVDQRSRFFANRIGSGSVVLVSESEGEIVGFCWPAPSSEEGWGEILSIYAHPDHWGRGHGRHLLEAGECSLREEGYERALLWVLDSNSRARRFYERSGWSLAGGIKLEEIGGVSITEVRYERDLSRLPASSKSSG